MTATVFENALPSFRLAATNHGDTLQKIAARELGDANRWVELVWINNLIYPYFTNDELEVTDRVLLYGTQIKIPVATRVKPSIKSFERDLMLENKLLVDNGRGDLLLAEGRRNLNQQLTNRLNTPRGQATRHPDYGSLIKSLLGKVTGPLAAKLGAQYTKTTLLSDYRVKSVKSSTAKIAGDITDVAARITTDDENILDITVGSVATPIIETPVAPPPPTPAARPSPRPRPMPASVAAVVDRRAVEASYYDLIKYLGVEPADDDLPRFAAMAKAPSFNSISYRLEAKKSPAAFVEQDYDFEFAERGLLTVAIDKVESSLIVSGLTLSAIVNPGDPVYINDEIMRVVSIVLAEPTSTLVVSRGCADSVPRNHIVGAVVWLPLLTSFALNDVSYAENDTVSGRYVTKSLTGTLDPDLSVVDDVTFFGRAALPYPPGRFRIDGVHYPDAASGVLTITWRHRDRLAQTSALIDTEAGNVGPEAGVTYSLRMLDAETLAVLDSVSGVSGTSATLAASFTGDVIIQLWSVRGGDVSWQRHSHTLLYFETAPIGLEDGTGYIIAEDGSYLISEL